MSAALASLIFLVGRVRVTEALATFSGFLVLTRAMPGAATALVPFPLSTTTTPMAPRVVAWDPALVERHRGRAGDGGARGQAGGVDQHVEGVRGPCGQVPHRTGQLARSGAGAVGPRGGHAGQVEGQRVPRRR